MGHTHRTKEKLQGVLRRRQIADLVRDGYNYAAISEKIGLTVQNVRKHALKIIATESKYPGDLGPEQVKHLRSVEAERIDKLDCKLTIAMNQAVLDSVNAALSAEERSAACSAAAQAHRALVSGSQTRAALLGLNVPQKLVAESWVFAMKRQDTKIVISFDSSPLEGPLLPEPIHGLDCYSGGKQITRDGQLIEPEPIGQLAETSSPTSQPSKLEYVEVQQPDWHLPAALPKDTITVTPVAESEPPKTTMWHGLVLHHDGPPIE
jgi:hypothetical protein